MSKSVDFGNEQRRVALGMAAAGLTALAVLGAGLPLLGPLAPPLPSVADRLAFALRAEVFVAGTLGLCIAANAMGRFFSPSDIAGPAFAAPSPRIAVAAAVLQNTLEQAVLAVVAHLALATLLRGSEMILLPLLVGLFCTGRLLFALGYRRGAAGRAFGFGLTFYPTLAAIGAAIILLPLRS